MYKIIYDEEELKKFFDILPPLKSTEVFFVSLSARNKYLTKELQTYYGLGRTEMFEKRIIRYRDWERLLRTLRKFETAAGSYLTKKGLNIPDRCITCYININPSDTLKAYKEFNQTMTEYMYELAHCATDNRDLDNISKRINKMDNLLMTCYQKNRGTKHFIDIDFDIPKSNEIFWEFISHFTYHLDDNNVKYHVIDTHSGYHVLLERDTVKFNFTELINPLNKKAKNLYNSEVVLNKNEMIPIPGTLQGNYEVRFIE
jgi:hypothetical protein